jgi:hypothetical protein
LAPASRAFPPHSWEDSYLRAAASQCEGGRTKPSSREHPSPPCPRPTKPARSAPPPSPSVPRNAAGSLHQHSSPACSRPDSANVLITSTCPTIAAELQRRRAIKSQCVLFCSRLNQQSQRLHLPVDCRHVQCRHSSHGIQLVQVDARCHQPPHRRHVTALCRFMQALLYGASSPWVYLSHCPNLNPSDPPGFHRTHRAVTSIRPLHLTPWNARTLVNARYSHAAREPKQKIAT